MAEKNWTRPPKDLDCESRERWKWVMGALKTRGLWEDTDVDLFEGYIRALQTAREARELVKEEGMTSVGSMKQKVEHPGLKTEREARRDALKYATALRLTPDARGATPTESLEDEFDRTFAGA